MHAAADLDAVERRHLEVEQRDVGLMLADGLQRRRAVGDLGDEREALVGLDRALHPAAVDVAVVGEDDGDGAPAVPGRTGPTEVGDVHDVKCDRMAWVKP